MDQHLRAIRLTLWRWKLRARGFTSPLLAQGAVDEIIRAGKERSLRYRAFTCIELLVSIVMVVMLAGSLVSAEPMFKPGISREETSLLTPAQGLSHSHRRLNLWAGFPRVDASSPSEAEILRGAAARIEKYRKGDAMIRVVNREGEPARGVTVKVKQTRHAFLFGAGVQPTEEFEALFNYAWLSLHPTGLSPYPGGWDGHIRRLANWCRENGIVVKGHPLIWHGLNPGSLASVSERRIEVTLKARVQNFIGRYRGLIDRWDVANEFLRLPEGNHPVVRWVRRLGASRAVAKILLWAKEANPDGYFTYDEWYTGPAYEALVRFLRGHRYPLHGIVIQSHMHRGEWPIRKVWEVCERYGALGVPVHFDELTVLSGPHKTDDDWHTFRPNWHTTPEGEKRQAEYLEKFYRVAFSHPAVASICIWDFTDANPARWMGAPAGLLREDRSPKPAYYRLRRLIREEWWTEVQGPTDAQGRFKFRGFYGDYQVQVIGRRTAPVTKRFHLGKGPTTIIEIVLPPEKVAVLVQKALAAKRRGLFREAEQRLREALRLNPENVEAHWVLAWTLALEGQYVQAIRHFELVKRLSPVMSERYKEATAAIARLRAKVHVKVGTTESKDVHGSSQTSSPTTPRPLTAPPRELRGSPVRLERNNEGGVAHYLVTVDLRHPAVRFDVLTARGMPRARESFTSILARAAKPVAVAVAGTFFDKYTNRPIGDLVRNGRLIHFGGMGTALAITADNAVRFIDCKWGRHMDWRGYQTVIACGPRLVRDGRIDLHPSREGFKDPHVLGRGCRTAVGMTADDYLLLVCVPTAITLRQLAGIMLKHRAAQAMNLDGGASTCLYYRGKTIIAPGRQLTNLFVVYVTTE